MNAARDGPPTNRESATFTPAWNGIIIPATIASPSAPQIATERISGKDCGFLAAMDPGERC